MNEQRKIAIGLALLLAATATVAREIENRECLPCHSGGQTATNGPAVNMRDYTKSVHGSGDCIGCHTQIRDLPHPAKLEKVNCAFCHESAAESFLTSAHGRAVQRGLDRAPNCAACHGAHDIGRCVEEDGATRSALLTSRCRHCHRGVEARLVARNVPIHVPAGTVTKQPTAVRWVARFYLVLIAVVVGLMAVHNLLDFLRKLRRRAPAPPDDGLRLTVWMRAQHFVLIVLFVVLAGTGFGHHVFGTRLHHVAGIAFVVLFVTHLVTTIGTRRGREHLKELRPGRQDWRDLTAALGGIPTERRWGYVEKVEYWSVLVGGFVISATGLVMLNAETVLRFVPVIWCDIAWAIHYYEAWLAVLAVLVWHLYAVVLNPDVFPMNPAWLTGRRLTRRGNDVTGCHGK
ncbi:MAG: hypothetical protein FJ395_12640 [Verrucomicrobia bacterium]|nr:hypothetical protein [Verrucomicrobiota bacterium]